jgi:hypothetical protein
MQLLCGQPGQSYSKHEIFGNLLVHLVYARFEVFTAVLLKIKVFCHWRIVIGVSKFILP